MSSQRASVNVKLTAEQTSRRHVVTVSLLLVASATAHPVSITKQITRRSATELGEEKLVPLLPSIPPLLPLRCPCHLCQEGIIPPYEIVGQITDSNGNPLLIVDPNGSNEEFFGFSGEDSDEDYIDGDYFSGEFDPEAIAIFCANNPNTPECKEYFLDQPPRVITINILAPPGSPSIDATSLNPSLSPSGVVNPLVPNQPSAVPIKPSVVNLFDQFLSVDPPKRNPVVLPPQVPVDATPLNPVNPLSLNPLDPLPLASVDQIPLSPLDPTPETPIDEAEISPLPLNQASASSLNDVSLVFPQDQSVLNPNDPLAVPLDTVAGPVDPNLLFSGTGALPIVFPTIDTRIT